MEIKVETEIKLLLEVEEVAALISGLRYSQYEEPTEDQWEKDRNKMLNRLIKKIEKAYARTGSLKQRKHTKKIRTSGPLVAVSSKRINSEVSWR